MGGRLQFSKNQTKIGIKKNLQSLNNANANLNCSTTFNEKQGPTQLSSAMLSKEAGAVPKGPLPSQHNAMMLIPGATSQGNASGKSSGAVVQNVKTLWPAAGKPVTLGSNSSHNMNFRNPQENSSCQMTQFNYNQSGHVQQNNQLSQDLFYGRYPHEETSNEHEHEFMQSPERRTQDFAHEDGHSAGNAGAQSQIQWTTIERPD